jgi:hypothetical protein
MESAGKPIRPLVINQHSFQRHLSDAQGYYGKF